MPPKITAQKAGYNLQLTKVTDIGGGHETLTINTALPPDATVADAADRVNFMGKVMQARINVQREKELARQQEEREAFARSEALKAKDTPVDLHNVPTANGRAEAI